MEGVEHDVADAAVHIRSKILILLVKTGSERKCSSSAVVVLHLVKSSLERHNGRRTWESVKLGIGSSFFVCM